MKRRLKLTIALCMMTTLLLTACGQKNAESAENGTHHEQTPITAEDGSIVVADKGISYDVVLMVTINPEALFYVDQEKNVLKIEALNKDAEDVLANMNFTTGDFGNCYEDFLMSCHDRGYIKDDTKHEIKITVIDKGEEISVDYCEDVVANAEELVGEFGRIHGVDVYASRDTSVLDPARTDGDHGPTPDNGDKQANDGQNEPEDRTCDLCGGVGFFACETCNGTGIEICIEHRTEEVRNDYVCPVCGGKGWVDDGMHGGLTAVCGHCTKDGGNADFKALAYDKVEMDVEVEQPCHQCGGGGKAICNRCNGSGQR